MHSLADTDQLVADGVITADQATVITTRAREIMVSLLINTLLCAGILAATGGLIFWLADAVAVAVSGSLLLALGIWILARRGTMVRMFGNASALIGAGMLMGGAALELTDKYPDIAGWIMAIGGLIVLAASGRALAFGGNTARFVTGAILLMGGALHLGGIGLLLAQNDISGLPISLFYLYCTALIFGAGWAVDVRFVTALAIAPFAQALETGTFYFHAAYVFYSPESTLSILQMSALILACLWAASRFPTRTNRHIRLLAIMAFIVANLCALVGSLWGDVVGETLWGPGHSYYYRNYGTMSYDEFRAARDAFRESALVISANVYSVLWALALAAIGAWAAHTNRRGAFNTALTFGAIHAYTQVFETFYDEPLAYVIGGLAAIPLAWGLWRLNHWLVARSSAS